MVKKSLEKHTYLHTMLEKNAAPPSAQMHLQLPDKSMQERLLFIFTLSSTNVFYMHIYSVMIWVPNLFIFTGLCLLVLFILEKMMQRYGGLSGNLHMIELDKDPTTHGLGIRLSGNKEDSRARMSIYVAHIDRNGPASLDGRIMVGDELLEVGETSNWQDWDFFNTMAASCIRILENEKIAQTISYNHFSFQINGQILYGRSHQNAAAIINNASSKVKIILIRWGILVAGCWVVDYGVPGGHVGCNSFATVLLGIKQFQVRYLRNVKMTLEIPWTPRKNLQ